MGILNIIGFETGDLSEAQSIAGAVSIVSSPVHSGGYALRINPTAVSANYIFNRPGSNGAGANLAVSTLYLTFFLRLGALPGATVYVATINSGGNFGARMKLDSSGRLYMSNGAESSDSGFAATLAANTWYRVDLKYVQNGTCEVRVDGGSAVTVTADNVQADACRLGTGTDTKDLYFDDVVVADDAFAPGRVIRLDPTGNGTYTAWTGAATDVDEVPHDGDTSYVTSNTSGQAESVALEGPAAAGVAGAVSAVKTCAIVRDEGGASAVAVRLRSGSTDDDTSNSDPGSSYALRAKLYTLDPADAAPWTPDDLAALQVGVVNGANIALRCTLLCAMVLCSGGVPVAMQSYRRRRA